MSNTTTAIIGGGVGLGLLTALGLAYKASADNQARRDELEARRAEAEDERRAQLEAFQLQQQQAQQAQQQQQLLLLLGQQQQQAAPQPVYAPQPAPAPQDGDWIDDAGRLGDILIGLGSKFL